jgi:hypothetical protein
MSGLKQQARIMDAVQQPDTRTASGEATALWLAACDLQDRGLEGVDVGLALVVRDKLDAMLARDALNMMIEETRNV